MTCVLCGAGAEVKYGLSGGANFALGVLGINQNEMNEALDMFYGKKTYLWCGKRPNKNTFQINSLFEAAMKMKYISGEKEAESISKIDEEIKKLSEIYTTEKKMKEINEHTSYMGIIDEHFHTIINPKVLGPEKFWRVVDCYTRAYLLMVSELLYSNEHVDSDDYLDILKNPHETLEMIKIAIERDNRFQTDSYYMRIRKHPDVKVVTTNYTPCCSIITKKENDVIYIHGRIGLFEVPYEWKVYDAKEIEKCLNCKLFFPYLFIQSGVKPIVEERQIKEYSRLLKAFSNKKIIILGYRINCDDNHINGLIRAAYKRKKMIVYLDYPNQNGEYSGIETVARRLRIDMPTPYLKVVQINDMNCLDIFENELR